MTTGPLRPGVWATRRFAVPLTFSVHDRGWVVFTDDATGVGLSRVNSPRTAVTVDAPPQVFTPSGKVRSLRSPQQAVALITANRHLKVTGRRTTSLGGVPATQLDLRVRSVRSYPPFCASPCVVLFGMPANSIGVEGTLRSRLWLLRHAGRTVVVSSEVDADEPSTAVSDALLRTLRFR
jgi:hypothetical protein